MRTDGVASDSAQVTLANRLARPLRRFLAIEAASSVLLLAATLLALAFANSPLQDWWSRFWHQRVAIEIGAFELALSLGHWVNDGLMTIFFFVVGLEIKRELSIGELASRRQAMLPIFGALGGMLAPASLYLLLQPGGDAARGWGIPMATDIAFAVAALAILGRRVSPGLKIFLLALAIVDDLGAVTVIAVFYTDEIRASALLGAGLGLAAVYLLRRAGVRAYAPYVALGGSVWLATLGSGVHATVAGVLLGLLTPVHPLAERETLVARLREEADEALGRIAGEGREAPPEPVLQRVRELSREAQSPLEYLTHRLHPWVAFAVMPIFALANAGVPLDARTLGDPAGLGTALAVALGLLLGKPLGITLFAVAAVRLGLASLPRGVGVGAIAGAGLLGGIGFTMALFITALAFGEGPLASAAKVGVLGASALACACGLAVLWRVLPRGDVEAPLPAPARPEGSTDRLAP
jgi:NhaA family Na+:H+ antiporter